MYDSMVGISHVVVFVSNYSVQDQLCCQKVDGYLTTTHLLLRSPEGPKYDMAQQKGVRCVTCRCVLVVIVINCHGTTQVVGRQLYSWKITSN